MEFHLASFSFLNLKLKRLGNMNNYNIKNNRKITFRIELVFIFIILFTGCGQLLNEKYPEIYSEGIKDLGLTIADNGDILSYRIVFDDYADDDIGGNADGVPNPGENMAMDVRVENKGHSKALGITAVLSTTSSYIAVTNGSFVYGDVAGGNDHTIDYKDEGDNNDGNSYGYASMDPSTTSAFKYNISSSCPNGEVIPFTLTFTDSLGHSWTDRFNVIVKDNAFTIDDNIPDNITVTLDGTVSNVRKGNSVTVTANASFTPDSYKWYLGSQLITGEISQSITFASDLPEGNYTISVRIQDGFNYYSQSYRFKVSDIVYGVWFSDDIDYKSPNYPSDYSANYDNTFALSKPGVAKIKLHFAAFNTETYDKVTILDSVDNIIYTYSEDKGEFTTTEISLDSIKVHFQTDSSGFENGWYLDKIEYMY